MRKSSEKLSMSKSPPEKLTTQIQRQLESKSPEEMADLVKKGLQIADSRSPRENEGVLSGQERLKRIEDAVQEAARRFNLTPEEVEKRLRMQGF